MNVSLRFLAPLVALLAVAACSSNGVPTVPGTSGQSTTQTPEQQKQLWGANVQAACPDAGPGIMHCLALVRTDIAPNIQAQVGGLTPTDFQKAYSLPSSGGSGQTVAIVDAYDNPNVAKDLKTYRAHFGLPTVKFTKYNQKGQTKNYPTGDKGWGLEIDLDVDMVSASCPKCTIDLIEANSPYSSDLTTAEAEAQSLGAHIITNSWGGSCKGTCGYSGSFNTPGIVYLASSGDGGYGVIWPSQLGSVVAVGGTQLIADKKTKRGWTEKVWVGAGGGCSTAPKPSWQHDPKCTHRTVADVSADAAPATGAAEYDSYQYGGWVVVGGTSLSSPLTAGIYGLAGNASSQNAGERFWTLTKKHRNKDLNAVTVGSDGSCGGSYLCTAGTHQYGDYAGPIGWGTPRGIGAF